MSTFTLILLIVGVALMLPYAIGLCVRAERRVRRRAENERLARQIDREIFQERAAARQTGPYRGHVEHLGGTTPRQ